MSPQTSAHVFRIVCCDQFQKCDLTISFKTHASCLELFLHFLELMRHPGSRIFDAVLPKKYSEYSHTLVIVVPFRSKHKSEFRTRVSHVTSPHHVTPTLRPCTNLGPCLPPIDWHRAASTFSCIFPPRPPAANTLSCKSPLATRHCVESPCRNDGCAVSLGLVI